jgi:hypothetical protein
MVFLSLTGEIVAAFCSRAKVAGDVKLPPGIYR